MSRSYYNNNEDETEEEKDGPIWKFLNFLTSIRFIIALITVIALIISKCS